MAVEIVNRKKKYRVVVRIGRKRLSKSFERKIDAERWERQTLVGRDNSPPVKERESITLDEFRFRFERDYSAHRHAPSTQVTEAALYKKHVAPELGGKLLATISKRIVESYLWGLRDGSGVSPSKANRVRTLLHTMFGRALKWDLIAVNPVTGTEPFPVSKAGREQVFKYLSQKEVNTLLSWMQRHDEWLYPQVRTLVDTGLRYGELVALRPEDVIPTIGGANLMISRSYCHHTQQVRERTKGGASRVFPLGKYLAELLLEIASKREQGSPLFRESWGECRHPTKFRKHLETAFASAKVRRVRIHDLRHTFAVRFLEQGGQLFDLQHLLGHSDSKLTERYAHFSAAMTERARGLVDHGSIPLLTVIDGGRR